MTGQQPIISRDGDRPTPRHSSTQTALHPVGQTIVPKLKGLNVYLIGMMGSGKSTVGKELAIALGYRFLDTDSLIEQAAAQPIRQIFAESGETSFRQLETQVLNQVSAYKKMVIATGGGIVLERQNWNFLHYGVSVWLDAPVDVLYERVKGDRDRPLLKTDDPQKTLQTILNQRQHLYAQADVRIPITSSDNPTHVVANILAGIQAQLKPDLIPPQPGDFEIRYDS
ncbi:MAG: shikimate kinase [Leptolyngbyaceae bacterium]|nr:shikimate kinase [Leptolyngbyaceae bacterium]